MSMQSKYIWMDGQLVEFEKATVHFLSPALHYGLGVFEGIRCYNTESGPAVFRLKEHMRRLVDSARVLGFRDMPYTAEQLGEATKQVISANGFKACYIRPLIYADSTVPSLNLDAARPKFGIAGLGMGTATWAMRPAKRAGARQRIFLHPAAPERQYDQGQGLGKLRQQRAGQNRIDPPGLR